MCTTRPRLAIVVLLALAASAPAALARARSAWDRPALTHPVTIVLTARNADLRLSQAGDYVIRVTAGARFRHAVSIWGGRNVVIDGGTLNITGAAGGMVLKNQTGTVWVHDLHIAGGSNLMEGIDLQEPEPGATVVLRDVLVDEVHGSYATNHADLLQTWAGPSRLLIDGFTGTTGYQGFFLLPNQWYRGRRPRIFDLRHVEILNNGGYALWRSAGGWPLHLEQVYVRPNPAKPWPGWWLWPNPASWSGVIAGAPSGGHFVTATATGATGVDERVSPPPLPGEQR